MLTTACRGRAGDTEIVFVGNVMIDSVMHALPKARQLEPQWSAGRAAGGRDVASTIERGPILVASCGVG